MERRFAKKQNLPTYSLLALILVPFVFVLTKIGEVTVRGLEFLATLLVNLANFAVRKMNYPAAELRGIRQAESSFISHPRSKLRGIQSKIKALRPPSLHNFPNFRNFPSFKLRMPTLTLHRIKKKPALPAGRRGRPRRIYPIPFVFKLRYFLSGVLLGILLLSPFVLRIWVSELPNPQQLAFREPPLTTKIYDREGRLLYQIYANQNRSKVSLSDIPKDLINATIAIEDKNFYRHLGFDLEAIARAARETFVNKNIQGGSTITQQLVKSVLLTPQVSFERKIKEIFLAFWAERIYSKDEILEMYLNQVPYGGTAWGIEAASQTYFGKSVKDLSLAEGALLAGLPSGPTLYSPFGANPEFAKKRQEEVLMRMAALEHITRKQADDARGQTLTFRQPVIDIKAPHFVMYVRDLLVARYGIRAVEQGGLRVITTLDVDIQKKAQDIVREELEKLTSLSVGNGAVLITNPQTGEILAMVGSRDYFDTKRDGNVNVTTSLRQPGSSIKVVTYATALEKGLTAASILDDSPVTYAATGSPPYSPVNYDGRFHGKVPLREAFANSYNVPAVKTLARVGIPTMIAVGKRLGITTWDDETRFGLSLTLGGGEVKMTDMATTYGTVANGGKRVDLTPFLKITNAQGESLEEKNPTEEGRQVLSEGIAFILSDVLADSRARGAVFGTNSILNIPGHRVSVKTGTSDSKRDNWTIGFTKDTLVAVWVGNNDNRPMHPSLSSGITGAAPIWSKVMRTLLADKPSDTVNPPPELVAVPICRINGLLPCGGCPTRTEYFVEGTQPKLACNPEFLTPAPAIGGPEPSGTPSN